MNHIPIAFYISPFRLIKFNGTRLEGDMQKRSILPFNIEAQFINADIDQLRLLAEQTKGKAYFDNEVGDLVNMLTDNDNFKSIQKVEKKSVPLIHFKWLLLILIISLGSEWFLRKYNGLI